MRSPGQPVPALVDRLGRVHNSLRISVTDRCNIRCFYCMPNENVQFRPRHELLSFEELTRLAGIFAGLGVNRLRITGGEPLVRNGLPALIAQLASLPGIDDLALTTNGVLLAEQAVELRQAGLQRLNISLDGLREETFQRITRRSGLQRVLEGIEAAQEAGFKRIRLNAVAIQGISESEVLPLARFAAGRSLELRFIEFMPLDAEQGWKSEQVFNGEAIRALLEQELGPLTPAPRTDPSQPAVDYRWTAADGSSGAIGFINPVTQPFCGSCNRLRVTAEGQLRNCLFSTEEWDARRLLRGGADDGQIAELIRQCVAAKAPGHGIHDADFQRPDRAMYQIGG